MIERKVVQYLEQLRRRQPLPLRVALWNGTNVELAPEPDVTVRLKGAGAARYFLKPSMAALGEGFV